MEEVKGFNSELKEKKELFLDKDNNDKSESKKEKEKEKEKIIE